MQTFTDGAVYINGGFVGKAETITLPQLKPWREGAVKYTISGPPKPYKTERQVAEYKAQADRDGVIVDLAEWLTEYRGFNPTSSIVYGLDGSIEWFISFRIDNTPRALCGIYIYSGKYKPHEKQTRRVHIHDPQN